MMSDNFENYEVGYKRPPREHQFKPGQSGNPKGRPKKNKTFKEEISNELDELIYIQENGQKKQITKRKALAKKIINEALSGKTSATKIISPLLFSEQVSDEQLLKEPGQYDLDLIQDYIRRNYHEGFDDFRSYYQS